LIYIFLFNDLSNRGKCIIKKTEREYTCMYVKVEMRSFSSVCVCVFSLKKTVPFDNQFFFLFLVFSGRKTNKQKW